MLVALPLGPERSQRPQYVFRYTFEHFADGLWLRRKDLPDPGVLSIVPMEAVAPGDSQVLAAQELAGKAATPVIDLDGLADFPSVESVVASTRVQSGKDLPHIRELLMCGYAPLPEATTLRRLTGIEALWAATFHSTVPLDLDSLPAGQMRKLAVSRWSAQSLSPLERMTNLEKLRLDLFRDALDPVSKMPNLRFLHVKGPAKGWAKLRECTMLEKATFIDVQIANLRRWNTWSRLKSFTLSGRGVKSLEGLERFEQLEDLTLLNLRTDDLSPLRELQSLTKLTLRLPAHGVDMESVAALRGLRSLEIDDASDCAMTRVPSVKPLGRLPELEELTLFIEVEDGDLMPLASLPKLRRVRLASTIGGDVEALRAARPEIELDYTPVDPKWEKLKERVGAITIQKPGEGLEQWSIFESLAPGLGLTTNYAAESRIKREIKLRDPELAKRLEWDTEAGAVGIYSKAEADIRRVADIVNELLRLAGDTRAILKS